MTTRTAPQTNLRTHAPIEEVRELERVISMHQAGYSDLHKLHIETVAALRAENQRLREALQDMTYGADCRQDRIFVTAPRWAYDNAKNALADVGIFNARAALKGE